MIKTNLLRPISQNQKRLRQQLFALNPSDSSHFFSFQLTLLFSPCSAAKPHLTTWALSLSLAWLVIRDLLCRITAINSAI